MPETMTETMELDVSPATYTVADIARLMQCSERHAWRLVKRGVVPGQIHAVGRLVRFSRVAVDVWLSGGPEVSPKDVD